MKPNSAYKTIDSGPEGGLSESVKALLKVKSLGGHQRSRKPLGPGLRLVREVVPPGDLPASVSGDSAHLRLLQRGGDM